MASFKWIILALLRRINTLPPKEPPAEAKAGWRASHPTAEMNQQKESVNSISDEKRQKSETPKQIFPHQKQNHHKACRAGLLVPNSLRYHLPCCHLPCSILILFPCHCCSTPNMPFNSLCSLRAAMNGFVGFIVFPTELNSVGAQTPLRLRQKTVGDSPESWWGAVAPVLAGWVILMWNYYSNCSL